MTACDRLAVLNEARRSNVRQHHTVNSPADHARDLVAILLSQVAEEKR